MRETISRTNIEAQDLKITTESPVSEKTSRELDQGTKQPNFVIMDEEPTAIRLISETFTVTTVIEDTSKAAVQDTTTKADFETTTDQSIGMENLLNVLNINF